MSVYLIQHRIAQGGGGWPNHIKYSNIWYVNASTAVEATNIAESMWFTLKNMFRSQCYCYQVYATDLVANTTNYNLQAIPVGDQRGLYANPTSENAYNPNNCLRVDLGVLASRPSRKFLRLGFVEEDIIAGGFDVVAGVKTIVAGVFTALLANPDYPLCDVDGQPYTGASLLGITNRRLGKTAFYDIPTPPPFG